MTTLQNIPANIPAVVNDFGYNLFFTADPSPLSPVFSGKHFNFGNSVKVGYELACGETMSLSNVACNGLNIGGKLVQDHTPVTTNLLLTPERVLKLVGKSWGQLSAVSAHAVGFMAASNIIAYKSNARSIIAQTSDTGICADHWYGYRFVEGECDSGFNYLITGRANGELVFKASSLPPVQTPTTSIPFVDFFASRAHSCGGFVTLSADEAKQYGFEQGVTLRQVQEFANMLASYPCGYKVHSTSFSGKYTVNQMLCLCGFMQYVAEWEQQEQCTAEAAEPAPETENAPAVESPESTEVESSEPTDAPEASTEQDCISGPTESSGSALAPAGTTALALPATAPIFVPEAAITVNKSAPSFFRDVNAGMCSVAPKFSTDTTETTANGPLAPERSYIDHLSFEYLGHHHYELDYSPKGWLWTFDDFVDMDFRGFDFKAEGLTLEELGAADGVGIRYLGKLVAHIEKVFHLKLGALQCPALENIVRGYNQGKGLTPNEIPTYSLLGLRIEMPVRREQGFIAIDDDELGEWRATISGYVAKLLCDAGFDLTSAVAFIKGWEAEVIEKTVSFLEYQRNFNDFDDVPF